MLFIGALMVPMAGPISAVVIYLLGAIENGWQLIICIGLLVLIACTPVPKPPDTPADET